MAHENAYWYNALALNTAYHFRTLTGLIETYATWKEAWQRYASQEKTTTDPEAAWRALRAQGIRLFLKEDHGFPSLLREIPGAPFGMYVKGILQDDSVPTIAIVGTRKASESGKGLAQTFARTFAENKIAIISGLAYGIDAAAHTGTLDGKGVTIAVVAHGLDTIYPRYHESLAKRIIASGGAIVSEYPLHTPALPHRFIERNRIVSGLSRAVVIIEAPKDSGALATARFAAEQGKEVFVLPGPPTHPHYRGSHHLIRSGATLVTSANEVLEDLSIASASNTPSDITPQTDAEARILAILKTRTSPTPVDKIIELSELETHVVTRTLSLLVIKHGIKENGEGYSLEHARHR